MSSPITEAVVLTLQPSTKPEEAMKALSSILHRQLGFQRFRWGQWEESAEKIQLFINWDDLKSHQAFESSGEDYSSVGTLLSPILAAPPSPRHVTFSPSLLTHNNNNVTELATFYNLSSTFSSNLDAFLSVLRRASGFEGVSGGNVVEELEGKRKTYMIATVANEIGFPSNSL